MSQLDFNRLNERLLAGGIAPRHVRRYIGELRDHFDDLVAEALHAGASPAKAEAEAERRLGNESELARGMLERRELRSLATRFPWAVFALGPIVLLGAGIAAALVLEVGVLSFVSHVYRNPGHLAPPTWFMDVMAAWNAIPTVVTPLAIAGLLALLGSRQRTARHWIVIGVVATCVLGGFQELSFTDNGFHGELSFGSGFMPPFPHELLIRGAIRAAVNLALVGGSAWLYARWRMTAAPKQAAES